MPLIQVHMASGRSDSQKRALLEAITKAVHESLAAPLESIRVWINEFPDREYMIAGEVYAERESTRRLARGSSQGRV